MTRPEVITILGMMKVAYPRFYLAQSQEEVKNAADLWAEMFKDELTADVIRAVKELINELEFPPTIADIKKKTSYYEWERNWAKELEEKRKLEVKERENYLNRQHELRLLEKPPLSSEEKIKRISECKKAIRGGEND